MDEPRYMTDMETEMQTLDQAELVQVSGGVYPTYDPKTGEMIGCTDPRRWGGTKMISFPSLGLRF